jgi:hypothetical protein
MEKPDCTPSPSGWADAEAMFAEGGHLPSPGATPSTTDRNHRDHATLSLRITAQIARGPLLRSCSTVRPTAHLSAMRTGLSACPSAFPTKHPSEYPFTEKPASSHHRRSGASTSSRQGQDWAASPELIIG